MLAACQDEPGTLRRVIGTGNLGYNGQDLPALETWLYFPSALRVHPDGRLVVVDFNNMLVRALEEDGTVTTLAGNGEHAYSTPGAKALDSALENPADAEWGPDGAMYVMAAHEARVLREAPDTTLSPCAGTGDEGYAGDGGPATEALLSAYAAGIAFGDDGTLYIADTGNNAIRAVDPGGIITTLAGAADAGFVDGPGPDARFSGPQHVAWDAGVLYVADANNHAIRAIDLASGDVSTVAGTGEPGYSGDGGPGTSATLTFPYGVSIGSDGTLWISDSGNNVVRRLRDGIIDTVAGTGDEGQTGDDGPASEATFAFPAHTLELDGDLYVADMKNGLVRVVRRVDHLRDD